MTDKMKGALRKSLAPVRDRLRFVGRVATHNWSRLRRPGRRARVPSVLQMEAVECGAACLTMILAYFGRYLPLEEVRMTCGVSRDGSKATNIVRAAKGYQLVARAFRREPEQLRHGPFPAILHWNLNHFVVLEGFSGERVFINDPARGSLSMPVEELSKAFTGIVLTFEKGETFKPSGKPHTLLGALRPRLHGSHLGLLYALLAGITLLIPGMAIPAFSRVFVDSVLIKGLHDWLSPLLLIMGATVLIQVGLVWLQQYYLLRLETRLAISTAAHFFWHVLRLPYGFFVQRYAGDIANRAQISDRVARLLSSELATSALDLMLVAFYALLMAQYDILLTAVGVGTALLNLGALQYTARRRSECALLLQQERGKLVGQSMAGLQSIETLKAVGGESDFFARWAGQQAKLSNATQRLAIVVLALSPLPALILSLNVAVLLGVGGMRVMDGKLTMGMLMAFQTLLMAFLMPVGRVLAVGGQIHEVDGGLKRLDDVLNALPDPHGPGTELTTPAITGTTRLSGRVELRDISFGFSRLEPPLISGFSLNLEPGSRVALVGKSGSGKSTVAKLITGLYDAWEGDLLFDGKPRSEIPRDVVTSCLAMVEQEVFLYEGTARENLTMWNSTPSEADLVSATRDACIYQDINTRPGGFSSAIEEGGRNFSGGQRQRFEIARALVSRPTILVLDEATSALDSHTEKLIDDNLRRRGCTCIIVAHRLSTIRDCDEILVMETGRIVQRGTHEELAAVPGLYQDLIKAE